MFANDFKLSFVKQIITGMFFAKEVVEGEF